MDKLTSEVARSAAILAIRLWVFGGVLRIPRGVDPSMILRLGILNTEFPKENFSWAMSKNLPLIQRGSGPIEIGSLECFETNGLVEGVGNGLYSISGGTWSIEWFKIKNGQLAINLMVTPDITGEDIEEVLRILGE